MEGFSLGAATSVSGTKRPRPAETPEITGPDGFGDWEKSFVLLLNNDGSLDAGVNAEEFVRTLGGAGQVRRRIRRAAAWDVAGRGCRAAPAHTPRHLSLPLRAPPLPPPPRPACSSPSSRSLWR